MDKVKTFAQLQKEDRVRIEVLLQQGLSFSDIARQLQRCTSTVSREYHRNCNAATGVYRALPAQQKTSRRHQQKPKHEVFDLPMKRFICMQLKTKKWSPELIAQEGQKCFDHFVCAEWIYQWIWKMKFSQATSDQPYSHLYDYLRHACRKRKRGNKQRRRGNILERTWIEHRPRAANQRKEQGHLECDIMLGKDRKPGLLVVLDRKTRKTWIRLLKTKDSAYVINKVKRIALQCSAQTITFDNDQSFAVHYKLHPLTVKTFFTHPYSSQEKGSVENRIGIIRMFFSKKTDFSKVTHAEVHKVQNLINNRPLRMFNYRTPNQKYIS